MHIDGQADTLEQKDSARDPVSTQQMGTAFTSKKSSPPMTKNQQIRLNQASGLQDPIMEIRNVVSGEGARGPGQELQSLPGNSVTTSDQRFQ